MALLGLTVTPVALLCRLQSVLISLNAKKRCARRRGGQRFIAKPALEKFLEFYINLLITHDASHMKRIDNKKIRITFTGLTKVGKKGRRLNGIGRGRGQLAKEVSW